MAESGAAQSEPMADLMRRLREAADEGERVAVRDVMAHLDTSSFATVILVPALILITPLSGIPTLPTFGAAIIALVTLQWAMGRDHLWLPDVLMRRSIPSSKLRTALGWLDRPAAWIDGMTHARLTFLTVRPLAAVALILILCNVALWPLLELLPMVTTTGAVMVALLAFGLMTGDGLFVVAGYAWAGVFAAVALWLI